ncbi:hypothetical protein KAT24_01750 [Candidatus Pacearchaeota archaeon]|nr:hypothetical protein [Candidatus Pacearchaeota archaeon]
MEKREKEEDKEKDANEEEKKDEDLNVREEKKEENTKKEDEKKDKDEIKEESEISHVENPEVEETEKVDEGIKKENKQLKKIFFIIGVFVLFFVGVFAFIDSVRHFTYMGIDFDVVKEGELILYRTSLPVDSKIKVTGGAVVADYNFYLRNDPRKLKNLPLEGELTLMSNVVINFTGDFLCGGKGMLAIGNLLVVLDVLDVTVIKNETAGCDPDGEYTFLQLQLGNETSIEQFGPSCYNLNINNCEVLEVTEKYIVGLLSEVNKNRL